MSTWDSEDFEPNVGKAAKATKWGEEDNDADTKDNWDVSGTEEESEEDEEEQKAIQVKKKKSLKETLAEKQKAEDEKLKKLENASAGDKIMEPKTETKDSQEADNRTTTESKGQIDLFEPTNREQFDKFNEMLRQKITNFEKSPFYVPFLDSLFRDASINLEADDVKKLISTLNAVSNEKLKQQKTGKGKKKSKKATLAVGKDIEKDEIGDDYDDFEDFI